MPLIEQHGFKRAGLLTEHQHQPIARGQIEFWVLVKAGRNLDDVIVIAHEVSVLDVHVAGRILHDQLTDRWYDCPALAVSNEPAFNLAHEIDRWQC